MRSRRALFFLGLSCLGSVALASELPPRKSGLWRIERSTSGAPSPVGAIEICVDEKTDDVMRQRMAGQQQKCESMSVTQEAGGIRVHSVCKLERTVATTEGKFTGSFDSAYRAELHVTYAPPIHDLASADIVMDAKWLGPCKAGQKAGDIVLPGGRGMGGPGGGPINVQELMKMRDALKKGAAPAQ
jgi:hypothetical protein